MSISIIFSKTASWDVQGGNYRRLIDRASNYLAEDETHLRDLLCFAESIGWLDLKGYKNPMVRKRLVTCILRATEDWIVELKSDPERNVSSISHFQDLANLCLESLKVSN